MQDCGSFTTCFNGLVRWKANLRSLSGYTFLNLQRIVDMETKECPEGFIKCNPGFEEPDNTVCVPEIDLQAEGRDVESRCPIN